ncbi:hypothetical protein [Coralliovum pocilloporae]
MADTAKKSSTLNQSALDSQYKQIGIAAVAAAAAQCGKKSAVR